jgi:hypothetical protein
VSIPPFHLAGLFLFLPALVAALGVLHVAVG